MENQFTEFTPINLNPNPLKEEIAQYYSNNEGGTKIKFIDDYLGIANPYEPPKTSVKTSDNTTVTKPASVNNFKWKDARVSAEGPISTSTNPVRRSASINVKAKHAMDYFINKGLTKEQAAGILGNLHAESGLDAGIHGDGRTSFGIAQWHNERKTGLENFAKANGTTPDTFETQLDYLWNELQTTEKNAYNKLIKTKTPTEAARVFANEFERMKVYNVQREQKANEFYNI